MHDKPVEYWEVEFHFKCKRAPKIVVKGYNCRKLPKRFIKDEISYKRALRTLTDTQRNGIIGFDVKYIKDTGIRFPDYRETVL